MLLRHPLFAFKYYRLARVSAGVVVSRECPRTIRARSSRSTSMPSTGLTNRRHASPGARSRTKPGRTRSPGSRIRLAACSPTGSATPTVCMRSIPTIRTADGRTFGGGGDPAAADPVRVCPGSGRPRQRGFGCRCRESPRRTEWRGASAASASSQPAFRLPRRWWHPPRVVAILSRRGTQPSTSAEAFRAADREIDPEARPAVNPRLEHRADRVGADQGGEQARGHRDRGYPTAPCQYPPRRESQPRAR